MCTNYTPTSRDRLRALRLGVGELPPQDWPAEVFPAYEAPVLVRGGAPGDLSRGVQVRLARFGLVPRWSHDAAQARMLSRHTVNARSETAALKPSFRGPWRDRHFALVPMDAFYEPCWEDAAQHGGHSVRWRLAAADGRVLGAAGLWERWIDPAHGVAVDSFTLLTVNADGHAVMGRLHRPGEEKRMPVFIPEADWLRWLHAGAEEAHHWMRPLPADQLQAGPAPLGLRPFTPARAASGGAPVGPSGRAPRVSRAPGPADPHSGELF